MFQSKYIETIDIFKHNFTGEIYSIGIIFVKLALTD